MIRMMIIRMMMIRMIRMMMIDDDAQEINQLQDVMTHSVRQAVAGG
jgi:hypothetical protein